MITNWTSYYQHNKHLPLNKVMENYNKLVLEFNERLVQINQQNQNFGSGPAGDDPVVKLNLIYDALSASGKIAFNAASIGDFFSVSAADYASVFAMVSGTTKYVMSDSEMNEYNGNGIPGDNAVAIQYRYGNGSVNVSEIPAGSYIIGFRAASVSLNNGTITPLISTTNASAGGTYTAISNSPVFLGDFNVNRVMQYYICKNLFFLNIFVS